jgi:two-component system KDP operon response regulator KdpE
MSQKNTLLLIEDDLSIRKFVIAGVSEEFRVVEAETAEAGIRLTAVENPVVILLDLGLPDLDGLDVVKRIREWSEIPIIVLSARGREEDKVTALDIGANDYVTKPFSLPELRARIRASIRISLKAPPGGVFESGSLKVDFTSREVFIEKEPVALTVNEYKLLLALIQSAGRVLTHQQLLKTVWGEAFQNQSHYVRVLMVQLRKKLKEESRKEKLIYTEVGVGYRLRA